MGFLPWPFRIKTPCKGGQVLSGIFLPAKGAAKISKLGTNDPDKIGLLTSLCYFIFGYAISGLRTGTLLIEPDNLPILGESRDILGGLGRRRPRGGERTDMLPAQSCLLLSGQATAILTGCALLCLPLF